jgi:hypothetical protein
MNFNKTASRMFARSSILTALLSLAVAFSANAQSVSVDITLNPAGNFKAETKAVTGYAVKAGDGYAAENIQVDISNLETGVSLRDKHTKKHLGFPKHKIIKLVKASGKGGTGEAEIQVMDKTQKVNGTYKMSGSLLEAQFKMTLSSLGIKDISYMGIGVEDTVVVNVTVPVKAGAMPAKASATAAPAKARVPANAKKPKKK